MCFCLEIKFTLISTRLVLSCLSSLVTHSPAAVVADTLEERSVVTETENECCVKWGDRNSLRQGEKMKQDESVSLHFSSFTPCHDMKTYLHIMIYMFQLFIF